jgi:hypothetical protein
MHKRLIESPGVAVYQQNGVVAGSGFAIVHLGHAINTRRSSGSEFHMRFSC